jgi:hypothetical protein
LSRLDDLDLSSGVAAAPPGSSRNALAVSPDPPRTEDEPLVDLPLRQAAEDQRASALLAGDAAAPGDHGLVAPLVSRAGAFAADAALVLLLAAASVLGATAGRGQPLRLRGLWWTAAFALYLSFFSTVLPLILFGKTVGMALTGLTARGRNTASPLTCAESARRWLGTALALAGLGLPLLATHRDSNAPSLADRLSRRPLAFESWVESPESGVEHSDSGL